MLITTKEIEALPEQLRRYVGKESDGIKMLIEMDRMVERLKLQPDLTVEQLCSKHRPDHFSCACFLCDEETKFYHFAHFTEPRCIAAPATADLLEKVG